ncbi:MAG: hypothetical protein OXU72_16575, partial [Gammaproteobacteria bacterium]|nr:hypothetical protein [Gammaproteobacteria bacterium]
MDLADAPIKGIDWKVDPQQQIFSNQWREVFSMRVGNPPPWDEDVKGTTPNLGKEFACGASLSA